MKRKNFTLSVDNNAAKNFNILVSIIFIGVSLSIDKDRNFVSQNWTIIDKWLAKIIESIPSASAGPKLLFNI